MHLVPVAVRAGQADRETFLHLDTSVIPHGATVPKLVLLLTEDANGGNANADSARIEALAVKSYFADGSKGASFDSRPDVDTSAASAPGVRGTGGAWTFDITPIVQKWADGTLANNGIGLNNLAFARCGWHDEVNHEALMDGYLTGMFGAAAPRKRFQERVSGTG